MSSAAAENTEPPDAGDVPALAAAPDAATPTDAAAPSAPGQPGLRRLPPGALPAALAVTVLVLGASLLMANLGLLAPAAERAVRVTWPAALIFAGVGLILAGERLWKADMTPFAVERGQAEQADLVISAGTADVRVESGSEPGGLAAGEWSARGGPEVRAADHLSTVRLEPRLSLPRLGEGPWRVGLASEVPWRLNVRSTTGDLDLDLAGLNTSDVRLRSVLGDVELTLPEAGGAEFDIALAFGDLTVQVPDGVGVKVRLRLGPLAAIDHDERRFIRPAPNEVGTPLYAVSRKRCTLTVRLGTGDFHLR
jgi:hypothetical protein